MPFEPDLRSSRMETSEGRGIAAARRQRWIDSLPEDVSYAMGLIGPQDDPAVIRQLMTEEALRAWARQVREQSELIGFWVAWHQAGGFRGLVASGWNRATIYRKLKQFRLTFDAHPDEHDFDWITVDLDKVWVNDVLDANGIEPTPAAPTPKRGRR